MPRKPFVAGNWKMNTSKAGAVALAKGVVDACGGSGCDVGIAPPFVYLDVVSAAVAESNVWLGAQDVYFEKSGAFTGEISLEMLKEFDVKFVLTGHSERRHVLKEANDLIMRKAAAIYAAGLIVVHCIGETISDRMANKTFAVVKSQLEELEHHGIDDPSKVVIAYEPVWAIGTGHNATDEQAQEVHAFIREQLGKCFSKDFGDAVRIQYGGSMKPDNAKGLLGQKDVDGGLIGGASLKADSFAAIVAAAV